MQITFVLIDSEPLERLATLAPDRDWREFIRGERAWILQTYLRLRAAGHPVALSARLPDEGIAIFSSKQRHALCSHPPHRSQAILVGVRADVGTAQIADFEVVQNRAQAHGQRRFFIPHWPQPALLPRDPARGARIENLAFKGFTGNLHPGFRDEEWRQDLAAQGLRWHADAVVYAEQADVNQKTDADALAWNDYREMDLILAIRPEKLAPYPRKPATKLYNAWHAGVPALLGPEIAYRELRRDALDYIEVHTPQQALTAIAQLRREPQRYLAMIEHGHKRAADFTVERILEQWGELLGVTLPRLREARHVSRWRGRSLPVKKWTRKLLPFANL